MALGEVFKQVARRAYEVIEPGGTWMRRAYTFWGWGVNGWKEMIQKRRRREEIELERGDHILLGKA